MPGSDSARKAAHLRIAGEAGVEHVGDTGLARGRLRHRALPERDLAAVALTTQLLGRRLQAPLVVSAMTGGTAEAATINARLVRAAAQHGVALVLGSGRALLDDPELLETYLPGGGPAAAAGGGPAAAAGGGPAAAAGGERPPLLLANLGAAQIRGREGAWRAEALVERLDADGLSIHLNPLQEAVQPEGEPDFSGVLDGIAAAVARIAPRPVVVKEVGFGLDFDDVVALRDAGVAAVDVAGAGGTNWALIEGRRDDSAAHVAAAFADWGTPTVEAIADARAAAPDLPLIASGGVRDGVEVAKCLALGATAAGMARPFLLAAQADRAGEAVATVVEQLRIATWLAGAASAQELSGRHLR